MGTIWNDNAARFTTTADHAIANRERAGLTTAMGLIHQHRVDEAIHVLARSVESQNRMAGNGNLPVHRDHQESA